MSGESHWVYGVHSVRTLVEKRPGTIRQACVLKGSRSGAVSALQRALQNIWAFP